MICEGGKIVPVYQGFTELGLSRIITIYHAFILTFTITHSIVASFTIEIITIYHAFILTFTITHSIVASFTIDLITLSTFIAASLKYQVALSIDRGIRSS